MKIILPKLRFLAVALPLILLISLLPSFVLSELDWRRFTQEEFLLAQTEDRSIAVVVHAEWCSTCRAQEPALNQVRKLPEYREFEYFRVDFDTQKDVMASLGIPVRSTILIFKGKDEVGRLVAESSYDAIKDLFSFGLD